MAKIRSYIGHNNVSVDQGRTGLPNHGIDIIFRDVSK